MVAATKKEIDIWKAQFSVSHSLNHLNSDSENNLKTITRNSKNIYEYSFEGF